MPLLSLCLTSIDKYILTTPQLINYKFILTNFDCTEIHKLHFLPNHITRFPKLQCLSLITSATHETDTRYTCLLDEDIYSNLLQSFRRLFGNKMYYMLNFTNVTNFRYSMY